MIDILHAVNYTFTQRLITNIKNKSNMKKDFKKPTSI